MKQNHQPCRVSTSLSAVVVALAVLAVLTVTMPARGGSLLQVPDTATPALTETETPPPETPATIQDLDPIESAAEAIARSMELFPTGHNARDAIARLSTYGVIDAWRHTRSPDTESHAPAWLVGILGDNLTINDILFDPSYNNGTPAWPAGNVEGGFYVWDANGGWRAGRGVLSATGLSYSSLASLASIETTITKATELPPAFVAWPTSLTPPPFGSTATPTAFPEIE